jgi:hypothetical protein
MAGFDLPGMVDRAKSKVRPSIDKILGVGGYWQNPRPSYAQKGGVGVNGQLPPEGPMPPEMLRKPPVSPVVPPIDEATLKAAWAAMDMHQKRMFMPGDGYKNFKAKMQEYPSAMYSGGQGEGSLLE